MRQITITGFLAADAEIKMSKQGNAYLSFRMANHEYNEEKAQWYNVTSSIPHLINIGKHLKKGSNVIITGDYSDDIYQTKQGTCDISRSVRAFSINFNGGGNSKQNSETKNIETSKVESTNQKITKHSDVEITMGEFKPQNETKNVSSTSVSMDDDDDLPF